VKPSPRVEGSGTFLGSKEGDVIEELKDLDIEDHVKVEGDRPEVRGVVGRGTGTGKDNKREGTEGKEKATAPAQGDSQAGQSAKPPLSPTIKSVESKVESPKTKTDPAPKKEINPPSPTATRKAKITPSKIPTPTGAKLPSSTSSVRTRTTSGSSRIPQLTPKPSGAIASPLATKTGLSKSAVTEEKRSEKNTTAKPTATPASKTSTPAKSTTTPAVPAPNSRTSTAQSKTPDTATKTPRPAPSSFSRPTATTTTTASNLTPSHTGSLKRASSTTPGSSSISPTPLRPQITGTPSKHTASSLAKAKEASEKRKSLSLGKSSGHAARQSLSGVRGETIKPKAGGESTPVKTTTGPSSGSRLLQGTASSRAKAAAAQPASPTRAKSVKAGSSGTTPVKGTPTKKAGSTPVKSVINGQKSISDNPTETPQPASSTSHAPALEPEIEAVDTTGRTSVVPRTPSPSVRARANETTNEDHDDNAPIPEISAGDANALSADPGRSAIIARVGLAGAREAPSPVPASTSNEDIQSAPVVTEQPVEDVDANDEVHDTTIDQTAPSQPDADGNTTLLDQVDPRDIDEFGQIAEPEVSRSASNPFGRIGHPGAGTKANELETPKSQPDSAKVTPKKAGSYKEEIKWNEEELKRDPGKTIVSPDVNREK
jgi:hypothetical protein